MTVKQDINGLIAARIADAWPGTALVGDPVPLTGGFWASMYRLRLSGQPPEIPSEVVFRIAPDAAMGAKECAVQGAVSELGFITPRVRVQDGGDQVLGGTWSVMDFAQGVPPLGNLSGLGALRVAPKLFVALPKQLAASMAALHALDPKSVTVAIDAAAPEVAWTVDELLGRFEARAEALGRDDLVRVVSTLRQHRPARSQEVVCHGDLHPFNLLVDATGAVTVVDWTASILAAPAFDVAYTSMLLANPPLDASGPIGAMVGYAGRRLAKRFVRAYRRASPHHDLTNIEWYCALHGARMLLEVASMTAEDSERAAQHPFNALAPASTAAIFAMTGLTVQSLR